MKRYFVFLCALALTALPLRADAYRDALISYLQNGNVASTDQYADALRLMVEKAFPEETEQALQAMTSYASEQMMIDIADIYLPAFHKHVSMDELQQLADIYSNPRIHDIQERAATLLNGLQDSPEYAKFSGEISSAVVNIVQGNKPRNLSIPRSVPKEYIELFNRYYEASGTDDILRTTFAPILGTMSSSLAAQGVPNAQVVAQRTVDYITTNIPMVLITMFHKAITQEDLQMLLDATASEAYHHTIEAVTEVTANPLGLTAQLMGKMSAWMTTHQPALAERYSQLAEAIYNMVYPKQGEVKVLED